MLAPMNQEEIIAVLQQSSLFQGMQEPDLAALLENASYKLENYQKSDIIALMGDKLKHLLLVLKGQCITRMVSDSGKYIQIEKIGVGRVLAPAMLFATHHVFPVNVIPEGEVVLLKLSKQEFVRLMQAHEPLLFNFIQLVSDINQFLSQKIHFLSLMSLRGKLAQFFLKLHREQGSTRVQLAFTRQELADKFGVSRQSLIRSLTELEEEGLIAVAGREISLLDLRKLERE